MHLCQWRCPDRNQIYIFAIMNFPFLNLKKQKHYYIHLYSNNYTIDYAKSPLAWRWYSICAVIIYFLNCRTAIST